MTEDLPRLDHHEITVRAALPAAWEGVVSLVSSFSDSGMSTLARVLGCSEIGASAGPLRPGSTVPGFRVVSLAPQAELTLVGRHRFARYALTFQVVAVDEGRTIVRAESRAEFPGLAGAVYRAAVVGTGAHVLAVRGLLSRAVRRAEEATDHAATTARATRGRSTAVAERSTSLARSRSSCSGVHRRSRR